jgi:hypothetical protein
VVKRTMDADAREVARPTAGGAPDNDALRVKEGREAADFGGEHESAIATDSPEHRAVFYRASAIAAAPLLPAHGAASGTGPDGR